jgi:hypothetical protein
VDFSCHTGFLRIEHKPDEKEANSVKRR